jgi:hypothetical protein
MNAGQGAIMDEDSSPDLVGGTVWDDSDHSWKASQSQEDPVDDNKINTDQLFLISLGAIMSLFT